MVTIVGWDVVVVTFLRSQALRLSLLLGTAAFGLDANSNCWLKGIRRFQVNFRRRPTREWRQPIGVRMRS